MTRKDIVYALSNGGKQDFITVRRLAQKMGVSDKTAKRRLAGVNAVSGKYYLITEVAAEWNKQLVRRD